MNALFAFLAGLVFGLGLLISGMTNPAKVLGFLDLFGKWDPSLALVMAGAIGIAGVGFARAKKMPVSLLNLPLRMPSASVIDRRLICGSMLFGIGWGLAGICPGPAIVLLGRASVQGVIFVVAMLAGMAIFELFEYWAHAGADSGDSQANRSH